MQPNSGFDAVYLQHVTIWWTKASRGMPEAKVRAQLPQTFLLEPAEIASFGREGGIHSVTMWEKDGFVPHAEVRALTDKDRIAVGSATDKGRIAVGAVTVQPSEGGVHLRFRYSRMIGAPMRSHRPPVEFDVAAGGRARIAYNGRFSGYSLEWVYNLSVITVAVGIAPSAEMFMVAPDYKVEDLAELF